MARKHFIEEPEATERWLVSYTDLLTSMFAFFVVLYAMSSLQQEMKLKNLSNVLNTALTDKQSLLKIISNSNINNKPQPIAPPIPVQSDQIKNNTNPLPTAKNNAPEPTEIKSSAPISAEEQRLQTQIKQERSEMSTIAKKLEEKLAPLIDQGKVHITLSSWGISVEINASILFSNAEAKLNSSSITSLKSIAEILKNQSQLIHVEGHTDNNTINTKQFPSNWELSSARAASVVRLFINEGISSNRLASIGYAENRPIALNDTIEGRMRNRRVQLLIMTSTTQEKLPKPEPAIEKSGNTTTYKI